MPDSNSDKTGNNPSASHGGPKKESILELAKLMDAAVRVKCLGGRELRGVLKGFDDLVNIVLDDCEEFLRGTSLVKLIVGRVHTLPD